MDLSGIYKGRNRLTGEQIAIGVFIGAFMMVRILYGLDKIGK